MTHYLLIKKKSKYSKQGFDIHYWRLFSIIFVVKNTVKIMSKLSDADTSTTDWLLVVKRYKQSFSSHSIFYVAYSQLKQIPTRVGKVSNSESILGTNTICRRGRGCSNWTELSSRLKASDLGQTDFKLSWIKVLV